MIEALILVVPSLFYFSFLLISLYSSNFKVLPRINNWIGLINLTSIAAIFAFYLKKGSHNLELFDYKGLGLALRIDTVSITMYTMVSIITYIVYRFSINYLAGDTKFPKFTGMFSLIAGSVQLLVISGNLLAFYIFWVVTSIGLQQLIRLYPERPKAQRAARTKFIIARIADITLLAAFSLIYFQTGTGDFQKLLSNGAANTLVGNTDLLMSITILLSITAILKSAQFPFHTWIFGVLESPTPVSALLHAGLLNAGPFLIIRLSELFSGMETGSSILLLWGAISAIYGSTVYITQASVKTGLVFSSIAHMGFSLMLCGLGLYSAAILHLVSHSFYKAYSFLRSGSIVDELKTTNTKLYQRTGSFLRIFTSFLLFGIIYFSMHSLVAYYMEIPTALNYLGIIIGIGLFALIVYSFDSQNTWRTTLKTVSFAVLILLLFYTLESITSTWLGNDVALDQGLGMVRSYSIFVIISCFVLATLLQILVMVPNQNQFANKLRVHLRNGLYVDSFFRSISRSINSY